jgi:ketosteroid isomerase-like protein
MKNKGMYTLRRTLASLIAAFAPLLAHTAPLDELLAADTAFAARSGEAGQHVAFAEYLAPDGILFRPEAVAGQQWLAGNEPATGRLEWWPSAAAVDCSGRFGVSTGPWRYTNAAGGEPVAGHYLSVWRRDDDGQWRVVLDHGIDHAPGAVPAEPLQAVLALWWPAAGSGTCAGRDGADHLARTEQQLDARVQREGLQAALRRAAAQGALAYRDDAAPGPLAGAVGDVPFGRGTVVQGSRAITVPGGDMAVTHGVLRSADGAQRALYIRVWQRERNHWRVAIDLRTPLPAAPDA